MSTPPTRRAYWRTRSRSSPQESSTMGGVDTFRRRSAYYDGLERTERHGHALLAATAIVSLILTILLCGLIAWAYLDCSYCLNYFPTSDEVSDGDETPTVTNATDTPQSSTEMGIQERRRAGRDHVQGDGPRQNIFGQVWPPEPTTSTHFVPPTSCSDYGTAQGVYAISDEALKTLVAKMGSSDHVRLSAHQLGLNLQTKINKTNTEDKAKERLFSWGNLNLARISDTYSSFISLLDNYRANLRHDDAAVKDWGLNEQAEISVFLNDVLDTDIMHQLDSFLKNYGYLGPGCTLRQRLYDMWFVRFPRSSRYTVKDSSGFEHVFVGETKKSVASGLHSWIRLYMLEQIADPSVFDYRGYISDDNPYVLTVQFHYLDQPKSAGSMFLGTSPEFDLAVYTVCLLARTNGKCPIALEGTDIMVQTYDVNKVPGLQVQTAYPIA